MATTLFSACIRGLNCTKVSVEVGVFRGLSEFTVVGLAGTAIREAKKRVYSAIKNSKFRYPPTRKIVNLGPADLKKQGSMYDLPIALGLLAESGQVQTDFFENALFWGELSLSGEIRPIKGAALLTHFAQQNGFEYVFVPRANLPELALIKGIRIIPVSNLVELVNYLNRITELPMQLQVDPADLSRQPKPTIDFAHIKGQQKAKRALQIAVAGGHHLLMSGPPGVGKTSLARAAMALAPELTEAESFVLTKIYSLIGDLPSNGIVRTPPFRIVYPNCSRRELLGGGPHVLPGEITLAHAGILFLDEFLEFPRQILELLRQPLSDSVVKFMSQNQLLKYPARFTLIAATNPCPCGYSTDPERLCKCTAFRIEQYRNKLSGPLKDRFDLQIEVQRISNNEYKSATTDCSHMREEVLAARARQAQRYEDQFLNGHLSVQMLNRLNRMTAVAADTLLLAVRKMNLSPRAYTKLYKVSLTIADLAGDDRVREGHILEALQYRELA